MFSPYNDILSSFASPLFQSVDFGISGKIIGDLRTVTKDPRPPLESLLYTDLPYPKAPTFLSLLDVISKCMCLMWIFIQTRFDDTSLDILARK